MLDRQQFNRSLPFLFSPLEMLLHTYQPGMPCYRGISFPRTAEQVSVSYWLQNPPENTENCSQASLWLDANE